MKIHVMGCFLLAPMEGERTKEADHFGTLKEDKEEKIYRQHISFSNTYSVRLCVEGKKNNKTHINSGLLTEAEEQFDIEQDKCVNKILSKQEITLLNFLLQLHGKTSAAIGFLGNKFTAKAKCTALSLSILLHLRRV